MKPTTALIVCAFAVAAVITGCSRAEGGLATPSSDGNGAPRVPRQLSPVVEKPRDVRAYGDRPCEVFTSEQLRGFGFDLPPDRTDTLPSGHRTCDWIDSNRNGELSVTTYPDWDILERTYLNDATLPVFEPLWIAGLPAVAHQSAPGMPTCYVTVGLAQRQGLDVIFTDLREPPDDPCGAARAAAEVAVGNLPSLD
ncbi:MAG: DUF3558 domain-containing protein [Pseudonocardiaceae bacterium]